MTPFDPAPGLIAPDFEQLSLHLPARCLFAFLSEARIERFAREKGGTPLGRFASITKSFPIYEIQTPDGPIALMQAPVGAPAAVLMRSVSMPTAQKSSSPSAAAAHSQTCRRMPSSL